MMRSAISSLTVRLARNNLPSSSSFRHNNPSTRSLHSSKPTVINSKKLIFVSGKISRSPFVLFSTETNPNNNNEEESTVAEVDPGAEELNGQSKGPVGPPRDAEKDRTKVIPVETSMRYLKSDAYQQSYGKVPVWVLYRRNFKGQFAPKLTRRTCIRSGELTGGNPCPICRDEYLVLDYRNIDLLKQFISPYNGEILSFSKTGLCQKRHNQLLVEILKAKDYGTITFDVPVREYDYSKYDQLYKSYREA